MSVSPVEYARFLDRLIEQGIAFACYFLPGTAEPILIIEDEKPSVVASYSDLANRKGFVFAPFNIGGQSPLLLFESDKTYRGFADGLACSEVACCAPKPTACASTSRDSYNTAFCRFMEVLHEGRFSKLVLSRKLVIERTSQSIGELFLKANRAYPSAFTYMVNAPQCGLWFGATPELLLKGNDGNFETVALAGTMPVAEAKSSYRWAAKEREEQQMVVDYISERLARCGITNVNIVGPITVQAGTVVHLKTRFSFFSKDIRIGDLVDTLHPTPAVCGSPKEDALRFIVETESHQREYYSGFAGVLNHAGDTELYVNLRCMKVSQNQLALFAGGGITSKSVGEKEWRETDHKFRTLLSIIEGK